MATPNSTAIPSMQSQVDQWIDSLWFRILLMVALGLGVFFRLAGLGNKMYSHDEAYTSLYAAGYRAGHVFTSLWDGKEKSVDDLQNFLRPSKEKNVADTFRILSRFEPHESPVFFLLANYWMRTVGASTAAMRGLAAVFSLLSLPFLYWLSRELFSYSGTARMSLAFFALSPYQILFAQDARPYSLWVFATLLSSATLLYAMRTDNRRAWLLYSLTLIFGVYCHQLFILVAVVHALYFTGKQTLLSPMTFGGFLSAAVIALFAFAPWLFFIITRWEQVALRTEWTKMLFPWYRYLQRWMLNFSSPLVDLDFSSGKLFLYGFRALLLLLILFAWGYLLKHGSFRQKKFLLLMFILPAGFFIIPDVVLGGIRSIGGRYFVPASIVTILVVAYFISHSLGRADSQASIRWRLLIFLLIGAEIFSNLNSMYAETWWNKELGRIRPEFIHEINKDQTLLILSGYNATNLGDILSLSIEVDSDIHFRLYEDPADVTSSDDYQNIYWLPSSYEEVQQVTEEKGLEVREVLQGTLWQIEGEME